MSENGAGCRNERKPVPFIGEKMRVFFVLIFGVLLMALAGCVSVGENDSQDLPWSRPAGWENQTLGVPL